MSCTGKALGLLYNRPPAAVREGVPVRVQALFAAAVFLACLVPAALNGYPLVFPDTEGYLVAADAFRPQFIRAFGYAAFVRATDGLLSLWLAIAAQAALSSAESRRT